MEEFAPLFKFYEIFLRYPAVLNVQFCLFLMFSKLVEDQHPVGMLKDKTVLHPPPPPWVDRALHLEIFIVSLSRSMNEVLQLCICRPKLCSEEGYEGNTKQTSLMYAKSHSLCTLGVGKLERTRLSSLWDLALYTNPEVIPAVCWLHSEVNDHRIIELFQLEGTF